MIYTSYYANAKNITNSDSSIVPVGISLAIPKWWDGKHYHLLAPSKDSFNKYKIDGDWEAYKKSLEFQFSNLSVNDVLYDLFKLTGSYDIALLCFETPDKNCHRHVVRDWLCSKGVVCEEWEVR